MKQPRANKNIRYRVVEPGHDKLGAQIALQNIAHDKEKFVLIEAVVDDNLICSHCATRHSSQGAASGKASAFTNGNRQ